MRYVYIHCKYWIGLYQDTLYLRYMNMRVWIFKIYHFFTGSEFGHYERMSKTLYNRPNTSEPTLQSMG